MTKLAPWASATTGEDEGWPFIISLLAGHDPARVPAIEEACTYEDVARAYVFKSAETPGVGFKTK